MNAFLIKGPTTQQATTVISGASINSPNLTAGIVSGLNYIY